MKMNKQATDRRKYSQNIFTKNIFTKYISDK